ncbi:MAG: TIGR00153 family protein [Magnetococcales bacterium]|nr:TIGR00153 family protein [Magnetococcales bacterium]
MGNANPLSSLFGKSPVKPLQQHMRVTTQCAGELPGLFKALGDGNADEVKAIAGKINELEDQADEIKNTLRAHLPKSLFMPVDRRDLLEVLDFQDSIADTCQDIAGLLTQRTMDVPAGMAEPVVDFATKVVGACEQASKIIEELDELVEMGFSGNQSDKVLDMVAELNKLEMATDAAGVQLTQDLFAHEDEIKPVSVVFWYQLIQSIGQVADYAEKVGDRLRLLLAR